MLHWPIGVFASVDAGLGLRLDAVRDLGVSTIQIHAPHASQRTAQRARQLRKDLDQAGIALTAVFGGFHGESYADIPTVARTVGLVPPETRQSRLEEMKAIAEFAAQLPCGVVALHLGFVPHRENSPVYREVVEVTADLCRHCTRLGQNLHLETGQESAGALLQFMADVGQPNLFVNFDPANMILYGTGEPLAALRTLGTLVHSIHCKDARWSPQPGTTWGEEVPLGQGDVDIAAFLQTLLAIGYQGPLTIEREIAHDPERQRRDIKQAVELLCHIKQRLGVP
jgi:sugar phosphate isomerase/epimerase